MAWAPRKILRFPSMCAMTKPTSTMPVTAITTFLPTIVPHNAASGLLGQTLRGFATAIAMCSPPRPVRRRASAARRERVDHILGPDPSVELLGSHEAESECCFAQCQVLAVRLQRDLCGLLVADVRVECGHQHERVVEMLANPLRIRLDAGRAAISPNRGCAFSRVPTAVPPIASAQTPGSVRQTPCSP